MVGQTLAGGRGAPLLVGTHPINQSSDYVPLGSMPPLQTSEIVYTTHHHLFCEETVNVTDERFINLQTIPFENF